MQKMTVELVDDLDGSEAHETVSFALDGAEYEIDVSAPNAERLRGVLDKYVSSARRVGGRKAGVTRKRDQRSSVPDAPAGKVTAREIRAWLASEGRIDEVSPVGRIPRHFYEEYERYAAQLAA